MHDNFRKRARKDEVERRQHEARARHEEQQNHSMAMSTGVSGSSHALWANAHSLVERDLVSRVPRARTSAKSASVPAEFRYRYSGNDGKADQLDAEHIH